MIHTAQNNPELLFNRSTALLFKQEIDKGNLDRSVLTPAFRISSRNGEFCEKLKPDIFYLGELLGFNSGLFKGLKYVKCD